MLHQINAKHGNTVVHACNRPYGELVVTSIVSLSQSSSTMALVRRTDCDSIAVHKRRLSLSGLEANVNYYKNNYTFKQHSSLNNENYAIICIRKK